MALSSTTRVGFGFQTAFGTAITGAAQIGMVVPVDPPTFNLIYDVINDQTFRGDPVMDYNVYQGVKRVEASVDGPFYSEEIGYFLKAIMGSEIYTSGTGVAGAATGTHQFVGLSQPSGATFLIQDDITSTSGGVSQVYSSMYCTSFGIRFSAAEGILTYTSTWTGRDKPGGTIAISQPAYSTTLAPWLGWQADVVNSGGSGSTWQDNIVDFEMTLNRAPSLLYTANNTQLCNRIDIGPMELTGRITVDYTSLGQLSDYESNLEVASVITIARGTINSSTNRRCVINIPAMHLLDSPQEVQRGGVSLAIQYGFRALGSASFKAPLSITLENGKNNGAYS